jgi:hypothetical protein
MKLKKRHEIVDKNLKVRTAKEESDYGYILEI